MTIEKHIETNIAQLKQNGFVIIPNLIKGKMLSDLCEELDHHFNLTPKSEGNFWGLKTKRMGRIFSKSQQARNLAVHPLVLGIMNKILEPYCERIQINLTQAIQIGAGEVEQPLHRDDELFPFPKSSAEFMVNAMWALDDFTEDNGATVVWPGSNRKPSLREMPADETIRATMESGSVLIWLGSTQHSGGANNTTKSRAGLTISYCLGWLRQAENQYLAYPPHIAKHFSEQLQGLIGYKVHRPNLGWYEGQEPDLLFTSTPDVLPAQDLFTPELEALSREILQVRQQNELAVN
ncbi:MAG: phytanoyl-CoA dioxygenase family protein [Emcibacter sp.]|nr:phytanoyl-CoA dioxygenase family protein [Emcibacter sp.]